MVDGIVHLYITFVDEIKDSGLINEYRKILAADELIRMEKFHHHNHRIRFLAGRALARTVLSKLTHIEPDCIVFSRSPHGRPYLQNEQLHEKIQFSLSYTKNLVAFAAVSGGDIGVDVEYTDVDIDYLDIAEQYFCAAESQELSRRPRDQAKERFFQYWTLKESYIKARGYGMNIALNSFSFTIPETGGDQIQMLPPRDEPGGGQKQWQFRMMTPGTGYQGALAVQSEACSSFRFSAQKSLPLVYNTDFTCL